MSIRPPSFRGSSPVDPEMHLLTGARALDALEPLETRVFDDHLNTCPTCADEYSGLQATAAMLGAAEALVPPARLRERILDAASRTPQLRPVMVGQDGDSRWTAGPVRHRTGEQKRSWTRRPSAWLAAAAAVVVLGGGVALTVSQSGDSSSDVAAELQQCVANDAAARVLTPSVGSGGTVRQSDSCHGVVVQLPDLPAAAAGQAYQMWLVDGETATSVGLVTVPTGGGSPSMVSSVISADDDAFAVTTEPAGGSSAPTTDPFWATSLNT